MFSVVVATPDVVGRRMAGPGIRAYHFARELSRHFSTTLVADLEEFDLDREGFEIAPRGSKRASHALRNASVIIGQPFRDIVNRTSKHQKLVFDLFDPVVLELPELAPYRSRMKHAIHLRREWGRLLFALRNGDLLIGASSRQRDFYTGVQAANEQGKTVSADRWIEVPFGVDEDPPEEAETIGGGTMPVLVWGGGVWPWLDPEMAVRAVQRLNSKGVECRLLFLGMSRPKLQNGQLGRFDRLRQIAGSAGDLVLWNEQWVPYRERHRWLRGSRLALMLHRRTLEAEFSMRTRMFDAIWCGLPVVSSAGGLAADLVGGEHLGSVVDPEDLDSVAAGIERLLTDDVFYARSVFNLERLRPRYRWSAVTAPLIRAIEQWKPAT